MPSFGAARTPILTIMLLTLLTPGAQTMNRDAGSDPPNVAGEVLRLDEDSNGREISLRQNQVVEIRLPENPTTGYRWMVISTGDPACSLTSDSYDAPSSTLLGKTGTRTLRFKAAKAGRGKIELVYRRPWEQAAPPARTFIIYIRVLA
jgi:inhibitor of cysteine peptidase